MRAADAVRGTALVTGASRGIGRAIALRLAREGFEVVAAARHLGELEEVRAEVEADGGRCRVLVLDVADAEAVEATLRGVEVELLVNNAGVGTLKPFVDTAPEEWRRMIDVNVNSLFHVTRAALPGMLARGRGHVCTIGSIAGRSAFVGGSCYGATKAFVTAWAESLMLEVRERGVKVSVVMPGSVATEFNDHAVTEEDRWKLAGEDVADAVAYLASTPVDVLVHRMEVRTLSAPPKRRA